jgi:hypothetical protein
MTFAKIATVDVLGVSSIKKGKASYKRVTASQKTSSFYMDGSLSLDIEAALDSVADAYSITRDPSDLLLLPLRAVSADRKNDNLDQFNSEELLRFDSTQGRRVFATFVGKPHFVNHNAGNLILSRGVVLDAHYNNQNPATDRVKDEVFEATGKEASNDEFVELLVGVDTRKDPMLARAYASGSVDKFSMGADVEATQCSIVGCDNIAHTEYQFCDHIRNKMGRRPVRMTNGQYRTAAEICLGTIFQEISGVDDPADRTAETQEGILRIVADKRGLDQRRELVAFVLKHHRDIPDSLAGLINSALTQ